MFRLFIYTVAWSALSNAFLHHPAQAPLFSKQPLSPAALLKDITVDKLFDRAKDLSEFAQLSVQKYGHPTRAIGSPGHIATLDYIYSTLDELGSYFVLQNQTFEALADYISDSSLTIDGNAPKSAMPMLRTPPTRNRHPISGPLIEAQNHGCNSTDYPSDTNGSVVIVPLLFRAGICPLWKVSEQAGKAGAVAVIVYGFPEHWGGMLLYSRDHQIAAFSMSDSDAEPYLAKLRAGETIKTTAFIDSFVGTVATTNIIAQTREGDPENCILLGAHSDGVTWGPAINDNGSGAIALLEVATSLARYGALKNCIRFAWWTAEEEGLLGSEYYMSKISHIESMKIRMAMDFDMLASPNFAHQIYNGTNAVEPVGSEELRDMYIRFYRDQKQNYTLVPFDGRSDYTAFLERGIPIGGISTGAEGNKTKQEAEMFGGVAGVPYDSCYHMPCDTLSNLNLDAWLISTKLVAYAVATYSQSLDGFPERIILEHESANVSEPRLERRVLI